MLIGFCIRQSMRGAEASLARAAGETPFGVIKVCPARSLFAANISSRNQLYCFAGEILCFAELSKCRPKQFEFVSGQSCRY
jgi:hypothetical protein